MMQKKKVCPHCGTIGDLIRWGTGKNRYTRYRCKSCRKTCNNRTGTIRYRSHLTDTEWKEALGLFCLRSCPSGSDLGRFLGRHPKTGQRIWKKVRQRLPQHNTGPPLDGVVEMDETMMDHVWIGGGKSRRDKTIKLLPLSSRDEKTLNSMVQQMLTKESTVITDEWGGYANMGYVKDHYTVCHSREFVSSQARIIHTNGIEGVWGHAKPKAWHTYRGYPTLSEYLQEICFQFNFRYDDRKRYLSSLLRSPTNTYRS